MDLDYCPNTGKPKGSCNCPDCRRARKNSEDYWRGIDGIKDPKMPCGIPVYRSSVPSKPDPDYEKTIATVACCVLAVGLLIGVATVIALAVLESKDLENWREIEGYLNWGFGISALLLFVIGPMIFIIRKIAILIYWRTGRWGMRCSNCGTTFYAALDSCPECRNAYTLHWRRD